MSRLNDQVISVMDVPLSKGEFSEKYVVNKDHEVFTEANVKKFLNDLDGLVKKGESDALSPAEMTSVEKGMAEVDMLVGVPVLDENGQLCTYYVRKKQAK